MLGNAGIVAAASTLILGFKGGGPGREWVRVLELVAGLLGLVFVSRNRRVDRHLTALIRRVLRRFTTFPAPDRAGLLELPDGHVVAELCVHAGDGLAGRSLADLRLRQRGVTVLGIQRPGQRYRDDLTGGTVLHAHDTLIVHAPDRLLHELDGRPRSARRSG